MSELTLLLCIQCVNKLLDALIVGEAGGFIRISQVDSTMVLLFKLVRAWDTLVPCGLHWLPEGVSKSRV